MRGFLLSLVVVAPLTAQRPLDAVTQSQVIDATFSADGELVAYTLRLADQVHDTFRDENAIVPARGGAPTALGMGRAIRFGPRGSELARLVPVAGVWQLAVRDSLDGEERVVTSLPRGVAAFRFSPDGRRIAFVADASVPSLVGTAFDAGDAEGRSALYLVNVAGDPARRLSGTELELGALYREQPDAIPFDWINDSTIVLSARVRGGSESSEGATLHLLDIRTAERRELAGTGGRWIAPVVSPNRQWIAFTGQPISSGLWPATELIAMRTDGTGLQRLTVGLDRDVADVHWSDDSKSIWFATEDRGTRNIRRVEVKNGKLKGETTGTHSLTLADVSLKHDQVIAIRSTMSTAGELVRFPAGKPAELQTLVDPGTLTTTGELEQFETRDAAGRPIDAWLHRPPGFTLGQKAPLVIDIHGGPHAMAGAGYAPWALAHASAGALVLRVNPRGSTGYGFDLANGVSGEWPHQDIDDLRVVLRDVIGRGLVDTTQIAVVGTGAGAVAAVALSRVEPLVKRVVLRCTGSDWLPGDSGYDAPLWSEWHSARPLRMAHPTARARELIASVAPTDAPTLVVEGTAVAPAPFNFGAELHTALGRIGGRSRFLRLQAPSCSAAGPVTQARLLDAEIDWVKAN